MDLRLSSSACNSRQMDEVSKAVIVVKWLRVSP